MHIYISATAIFSAVRSFWSNVAPQVLYISALPQSIAEAPLLCNAASFRFCENDSFVKHVLLKHINSLNRKIMEPFRFLFVEFSRNGIPLESLAERCGKSHFESRQLYIFSFALPQYIFECPEYCGSTVTNVAYAHVCKTLTNMKEVPRNQSQVGHFFDTNNSKSLFTGKFIFEWRPDLPEKAQG
jgi:hypothetical protein